MINQSLEQINLTRERSLLMIKARWFLGALLLIYTTIITVSYNRIYTGSELFQKFGGLYIVIAFLVIFNALLHWSYSAKDYLWRHKINTFVTAQLIADLFAALAFVHFSGGILSWFWTLFLLYTIELTYFLPTLQSILTYGGISLALYSVLVFGERYEIIPSVKLLFLRSDLQTKTSYVFIVWFWVVVINFITAFVSFHLRVKEEPSLADRANRDSQTKLYNKKRFYDFLNSEFQRGQRYARPLSLMYVRIDNLSELINVVGLERGDKVLKMIGDIFKNNLRRSDTMPSYDIDIACRIDQEVFAIILPETPPNLSINPSKRLQTLVKEKCNKISKKVSVSLSIGISGFPESAASVKDLVSSADEAATIAKVSGKITCAKPIKPSKAKV